jgi:hypothetical protein
MLIQWGWVQKMRGCAASSGRRVEKEQRYSEWTEKVISDHFHALLKNNSLKLRSIVKSR